MASLGHLKRIWKDAFRVAGAVQEMCSSEMLGGQGADFLRGGAFWSISQIFRFAKMILRGRCSTSYDLASLLWQAQYCKQMEGKKRKMHWHEAFSSALNFPCLKEVSQNCFVFDVVKFKKLNQSRRIASFWMLSSSKSEVSKNCFVLDIVNFEK